MVIGSNLDQCCVHPGQTFGGLSVCTDTCYDHILNRLRSTLTYYVFKIRDDEHTLSFDDKSLKESINKQRTHQSFSIYNKGHIG